MIRQDVLWGAGAVADVNENGEVDFVVCGVTAAVLGFTRGSITLTLYLLANKTTWLDSCIAQLMFSFSVHLRLVDDVSSLHCNYRRSWTVNYFHRRACWLITVLDT